MSGLTTAICLAESGHRVRVRAALPPDRTTSACAGASWGPYMVSDARVLDWSIATLREFERLPEGRGVRFVRGMEASPDDEVKPPEWVTAMRDYRLCDRDALPEGYALGWWFTIPLVDMPVYLRHLTERLAALGVGIEVLPRPLAAFAELDDPGILINCTGLGSRLLVEDSGLEATRGQLVVVEDPGLDWFFQDDREEGELTYFLPHGRHVVLGGYAEPYHGDPAELRPDPEIARRIVERCAAIEPRLAGAVKIEDRVGLRPNRKSGIRIEAELVDGVTVIHNYGHAGSGVTLSWGCAQEVSRLVREL
ncbi:putative D-amino-acid oxidase [Catellatospora sp. TT07R-123]|nr:putative D-amino-acid oxidase [Catellatospora sp. TT07R-123]